MGTAVSTDAAAVPLCASCELWCDPVFVEIDADVLTRKASVPMLEKLSSKGTPAAKGIEVAASDAGDRTSPVRVHMESIAYNDVGRWLVQAINQAAFALRLQEAGLDPAVVASFGPALRGADGILFETWSGPVALELATAFRRHDPLLQNQPMLLSLTLERFKEPGHFQSLGGQHSPEWFAGQAEAAGFTALGVNCGRDIAPADCAAILRAWGAIPCPECKRYLLPRVGEVGIAQDEAAPVAQIV